MATSRRVARVSELIKREVSQMLLSGIKDDRVGTGMVSVTNVDVSGDLQHAKIFVSIYGSDTAKQETMAGLKSATGYVRSELGQRIRLRRTPEVIFLEDRSLEQGDKVLNLLSRLSQERQYSHPDDLDADSVNSPPLNQASEPDDDEDDEDDDYDEDDEDDEDDDYDEDEDDEDDEDEEEDDERASVARKKD